TKMHAVFLYLWLMILGMALTLLHRPAQEERPVSVWLTTPDQRHLLTLQPPARFGPDAGQNPLTIDLDESQTYQRMEGFGAALTESSAWLLQTKLNPAQRDRVMGKLFDPKAGIGLSYLRLPMGASDFALRSYTYDDMPPGQSDPALAHFSIAHDSDTLLPTLQQARALNPALQIMATPWSAPAWMKTSGSLNSGKLRPDAYAAYARYFVRFLRAYHDAGIPIHAVTLQNEPHHEPAGYPCMRMEPGEQAEFVKNHLGPQLAEAGLKTHILVWDHNWNEPEYPIAVLRDAKARPYIAGSAFHAYEGSVEAQSRVHAAFPDKDLYFTECSGGEWATDFGGNLKWYAHNLLIGATRHWAKTVLLWNLALDEQHGPQNGGCTNCRGVVTIRQRTGEVVYNVETYLLGHASKFVLPGAVRIGSNTFGEQSIENVAFENPNGSLALIVLNGSEEAQTFKVRWRGQAFVTTLPAGALATFCW
ncbi:MAG TPA: glycoside hydrolase family 30 beta sandwich domain-containing protein, partial [Chthonomonadaceae bacterium]|nr:glycoside hydrolase family 30 beta sandwich domain-containing protein [Chthonomonadaceae bacterium]